MRGADDNFLHDGVTLITSSCPDHRSAISLASAKRPSIGTAYAEPTHSSLRLHFSATAT